MALTKKHFVSLAEIVRELDYDFTPDVLRHKLKQELATWCEHQNHRFNRSVFFEACEPREDESQ